MKAGHEGRRHAQRELFDAMNSFVGDCFGIEVAYTEETVPVRREFYELP